MTIAFQLASQQFAALNGGPHFKFTEAISFVVNCETQEEVDEYWEKLSAGGQAVLQMKRLDIARLEEAYHQQ